MSGRRQLGDLLVEITDAVLVAARGAPGLKAKRVEIVLPIEIEARGLGGEPVLFGDVPRSRLFCDFDWVPNRFSIVWEDREAS
jgi:hypothetical protein